MLAFQKTLIKDLDEDQFADVIAQTVSYGLLTARLSSDGQISLKNLVDMVPSTNPFLKELLQHFLTSAGMKGLFDVDEAGINDVVELLNRANAQAIRNDFGKKTDGEDPVIHFYEHFLGAYNKKLKVERGVFYTPKPIVSYIVRSVHELLQKEFGLEDGLADTSTWAEVKSKHNSLEIPEGIKDPKIEPFVQILDPATGTATFLIEVIDVIHNTLVAKWDKERISKAEQIKKWNTYVPTHLLPRLYAYELMMAPYAIAHMKVGLKLTETGFTAWEKLGPENRANIFLTNALEPWAKQLDLPGFEALAHEAAAVNEVKKHKNFTVVVGNPPYSGISSNMSEHAQKIVDAYRFSDGEALNEKKVWLQDDYVKFTRNAQVTIEETGYGIVGFITNHGYLDNPTFRGMRQSLMGTFNEICIINLHGNANKKEQSPDGSIDKNVFDIRQGVGITLACRNRGPISISHSDIWGSRESKYDWLNSHGIINTPTSVITPDSPFYLFEPQNTDSRAEYNDGIPVTEIFPYNVSGIVTARDGFVIEFEDQALGQRIRRFLDPKISDNEIQSDYDLSENYAWRVTEARKELRKERRWEDYLRNILYRPFDLRRIVYHKSIVFRTRAEGMRHMLSGDNLALSTTRSIEIGHFEHVFCTREIIGHHSVSLKEVNYMFPLWLSPDADDLLSAGTRRPNLSENFLHRLKTKFGAKNLTAFGLPEGITPEDAFNYTYSILHSKKFRSRYANLLKIDFPRIPLADKIALFKSLAKIGHQLSSVHLLESSKLNNYIAEYNGGRAAEVEKPTWSKNTVWIDKSQTVGFKGVKEDVWNFHIGGYQVCEKWLKDRKGRKLTKDDIDHYQKIVVALSETIRLMAEIDKVIDEHGGWAGAFQATN
jgi:predicted helicase